MAQGGAKAPAGPSVADEKAALKEKGLYFQQGSGPDLGQLEDAWIGMNCWAQTVGGHEARCGLVGRDGYFETARCAVEMAMTLRFDKQSLPVVGGVLNATVVGQTWYAERLINSGEGLRGAESRREAAVRAMFKPSKGMAKRRGLKFRMGSWMGPEASCQKAVSTCARIGCRPRTERLLSRFGLLPHRDLAVKAPFASLTPRVSALDAVAAAMAAGAGPLGPRRPCHDSAPAPHAPMAGPLLWPLLRAAGALDPQGPGGLQGGRAAAGTA